jgi:hypothetical protein
MPEKSKQEQVQATLERMKSVAETITIRTYQHEHETNEGFVSGEIATFFDRSGNAFFLNDISWFTTSFSEYMQDYKSIDTGEYQMYIGMSLGSMISVMSGVDVETLRFKFEHILNRHDDVTTKARRYEKAFFDSKSDVVIELLPRLFGNDSLEGDYYLSLACALNLGLEVAANPKVAIRAERARRQITTQIDQLVGGVNLTSVDLEQIRRSQEQ